MNLYSCLQIFSKLYINPGKCITSKMKQYDISSKNCYKLLNIKIKEFEK